MLPDPGSRQTALITGLAGQDGSFLAELLLEKGYEVVGTVRPGGGLGASAHLQERVKAIEADLFDPGALTRLVADLQPAELYHLAAPSFVPDSWKHPARTMAAIPGATASLLEAVRDHSADTRVFVAGSAAMFGEAQEVPQHEETLGRPLNPYAVAKLATHLLTGRVREHDGLFACSGILYNHESERRPESFVPRRISRAAAAIKLGQASEVTLGALDAVRDWSFAGDIVRGAWLILQQERPDDYILASGTGRTVAELAEAAFACVGLEARDHVRVDADLVRRGESMQLVGDPSRARDRLGWEPSLSFEQLIERMVQADLRSLTEAD